MKRQFVTYEIAVKLRELGFDHVNCLGYYQGEILQIHNCNNVYELNDTPDNKPFYDGGFSGMIPYRRLAPLWQQVIEWFKTKHNIHIHPNFYENKFNHEMCYEYRVHYKSDEWRLISISSADPLESAIYEAIKLIKL